MPLIRNPSRPAEPVALPSKLSDGTVEQRWAAVRAAAESRDGVPLLAAALPDETDVAVRGAIFTALSRIGTSESAAVLVPYVRSHDAALRTGAIDALRAMPEVARVHVRALLADPDADVRLLSCELARVLPDGDATRLLCDLLHRETEKNVCAAALEVLAEVGQPQALPTLRHCAERFGDDPFIAFSIKVANDRIGGQ
jgi:HEAT repeat protein